MSKDKPQLVAYTYGGGAIYAFLVPVNQGEFVIVYMEVKNVQG